MIRSKSAVGVDIGSSTVKVAQLKKTRDGYELEKVAEVAIYPDGEKPGDPNEQRKATIKAIRHALSSGKITSKNAVSSVSGESIIVRYLQLPDMPEDELKKALRWEAEEYIPFRLDEVNIDSMVLGKSEAGDDRVDVLLVSAKKDLVENHVSLIREAGLTPKIVDLDSFAFLNCFEINSDPGVEDCIALINIGAEITGISIYHNGVSRFSRDISIGGETITSAIRSHLRCSHKEAETLKRERGVAAPKEDADSTTVGFSGSLMDTIRGAVEDMTGEEVSSESQDQAVAKAVGTVVLDLISEVRRSVEFFENQIRGLIVARIVIGGGTSVMPNLREHFERELGLPVEIIDPLRKVRATGKDLDSASLDSMRHTLGVGIGLGIRGCMAA